MSWIAAGLHTGLAFHAAQGLVAWQEGATWSAAVNEEGIGGSNVAVGVIEADVDPGPAITYRIDPDYFIGSFVGILAGKEIVYYDPGSSLYTNFSWHASGSGMYAAGRYSNEWGLTSARGVAMGITNLGNYEATYFITNHLALGLPLSEDVFSLAFTTTSNGQGYLTAEMDRLVDTQGKFMVQGVRPWMGNPEYGGDHPVGMGVAYNILTVGKCLNDYRRYATSQYGPVPGFGTAKPELLCGHVSESAATARGAGGAALLLDRARWLGWTNAEDPRVVKAIMLTGATKTYNWDKGADGVDDDHRVPLDFNAGAGVMNCLENDRILTAGESEPATVVTNSGWDFGMIEAGGSNAYAVVSTNPSGYLVATLAWNRHVDGGSTNLQDLNLHLYTSTGGMPSVELDWSTSQVDSVEHLFSPISTAEYALVVNGQYAQTNEAYGLAWRFTTNGILFPGDADGDGLPDSFENAHFAHIFVTGPTNDPDGDGVPNLAEYLSDTAPTNGQDYFSVQLMGTPAGYMDVEFSTRSNRVYRPAFKEGDANLGANWTPVPIPAIVGNGGTTNWIDDGTDTGVPPLATTVRCYRVSVGLQ